MTPGWTRLAGDPGEIGYWDGERFVARLRWDGTGWVQNPGPGWWEASDHNFYPPELHPSAVATLAPPEESWPLESLEPIDLPDRPDWTPPDVGGLREAGDDEPAAPPKKRRRRRLLVLATAGVVAAGAAVGYTQLHGHVDAAAQVDSAVNGAFTSGTAQMSMVLSGSSAGHALSASGSGGVDFVKSAMVLNMSVTTAGQQVNTRMVFLAGTLYENVPALAQAVPGKSWVSIDLSSLTGSSSSSASAGALGAGQNPASMLRLLAVNGDTVTPLGAGTVQGTPVQRYAVTVSATQVQQQLAQASLPAWMRQVVSMVQAGEVHFTVALDGQGRLRQEVVSTHAQVGSSPLSLSETLDFSNYGSPVVATAPPASQVLTLQQLLAAVGSGK